MRVADDDEDAAGDLITSCQLSAVSCQLHCNAQIWRTPGAVCHHRSIFGPYGALNVAFWDAPWSFDVARWDFPAVALAGAVLALYSGGPQRAAQLANPALT